MVYERIHEPLAPRGVFLTRVARSLLWASGLIGVSLFIGMAGYHYLQGLSWIDSFVNASMILSGMGPLAMLDNAPAKLFAGLYALYSGLVLIAVSGLVLAAPLHRLLHRFHIQDDPT